MGYYIFHNKTVGEAQIHYGDCPHCRHGYGRTEEAEVEPKGGEWLGPFSSYHDAEMAAGKARAHVRDCVECMP
ncbi:MAG: hypothetical protein C4520_09445 [Candidatus Abyssobacteria bacterium SURF_5]|uniref:Uncharacterized protein n=1 Tax=Abyssobacteria bacterium (strain SURF_5) TaxID=2093360 RepID=A0A3A4NRJ8_ABYX5|nr:MAG: hypothetical protein C4520_09445 [Candidatus Abyssubacteria bacterium SURF_5]